jgi:hypothetical protein
VDVLMALAVVLAVRVVLVGNPWVWRLYEAKLHPDDIGWRQHSIMTKKRQSYDPLPSGVRYLAVGSSQTDAIYGAYAERHHELVTFGVAAMGPFDFVTFERQIVAYRPERILLYLSDFDLARPPDPAALVIAPAQGSRLPRLWRDLAEVGGEPSLRPVVAELAVGELFPEFKYRFVFRGIVQKAFQRIAARSGARPEKPAPRETIEQRIGFLRAAIAREPIAFNLHFLRRFLEDVTGQGIQVVIVEGQYNPVASDAATEAIAAEVAGRVRAMREALEGVRYVSRAELRGFVEADYVDLSHVRPEVGYAFTRDLLALLEASTTAAQ